MPAERPLSESIRLEAERAGYIYLDEPERVFLAETLLQASLPMTGRLSLTHGDRVMARELRERIRPRRRPEDMDTSDGLGT